METVIELINRMLLNATMKEMRELGSLLERNDWTQWSLLDITLEERAFPSSGVVAYRLPGTGGNLSGQRYYGKPLKERVLDRLRNQERRAMGNAAYIPSGSLQISQAELKRLGGDKNG